MSDIKQALWAETLPDVYEGCRYFNVGRPFIGNSGKKAEITAITVQRDVPGLHCNLDRVCIWVGDTLAAEFPYLNAAAVGYL